MVWLFSSLRHAGVPALLLVAWVALPCAAAPDGVAWIRYKRDALPVDEVAAATTAAAAAVVDTNNNTDPDDTTTTATAHTTEEEHDANHDQDGYDEGYEDFDYFDEDVDDSDDKSQTTKIEGEHQQLRSGGAPDHSYKNMKRKQLKRGTIYDLARLWHSVTDLIQWESEKLNDTFHVELARVDDQLSQVNTSLGEKGVRVNALEEIVKNLTKYGLGLGSQPEAIETVGIGAVRLLSEKTGPKMTRGRLQIYTGEELGWGFVCDDLFYSDSIAVACKQLGYVSGVLDLTRSYSSAELATHRGYSIVLDNVDCDSSEPDLLACDHESVGVHNCVDSEIVDVMCFK